ncbi:hypothetical protein FE784_12810 [Paenibacillus hemerocallicola]|uniref:Uncharacterized protein n=1 Tax=Paenibacillus hemerocallicola TaxID=1172614 RepID=A0A5C4TA72_9BACL|nr:hypothetical protein [Paenibacillus hemerocallicola]TNJ65795.1 hypothetical protein FE784_12810 [Paenibacillus hemerocallicola]
MNIYSEIMNRKFGEVITEEQFTWLNEIVFLSALEEVLSSSEPARQIEGAGPYPEQFELLNKVFGMKPVEFDERIQSFERHRKRKKGRSPKYES